MYLRHEINVLFRKCLNYYFLLSSLIELAILIVNTNKDQRNIKQNMLNFKFFSNLHCLYYLYMCYTSTNTITTIKQ